MSIDNITRNNTVDEWRIQTNQSANALNHIEAIDYVKSNGIFQFSGPTTTLLITASGTPLQVVNTAQFQTTVEVGETINLGDVPTKKGALLVGNSANTNNLIVRNDGTINRNLVIVGNTTAGNLTTANATQTGNLRVTYDANVGTTLVVTGNTTAGNLTTANATNTGTLRVTTDATVGANLTVTVNVASGNLSVTNSVNVGTTLVVTGNTTAGNLTTANATSTGNLRVTSDANVGTTLVVTGNTTAGNLITANATQTGNLRVTSDANVGTTLVVTGNTTSGNLTTANVTQTGNLRVISDANVGTTLVVTGNTTAGNLITANATQTGNLRVISDANVGTTLVVTGNTTSGNLTTANATNTGTLRVTTDATVGANLTVTVNVAVGNLSTANSITAGFIGAGTSNLGSASAQSLTVAGNFTLLGNTIFDSDRITLRANTPTNIGVDNSFIEIRRQKDIDVGTSANANAQIRWNESAKYFDIRNVDNPNLYEKILTSNLITDSTTTTSSTQVASATAIKTTNDNITANVLNSGAAVVVAHKYNNTTSGDPGAGFFRFNNLTIASVSSVNVSNTDNYGATVGGILSAYGDSTNTIKGHLRFSVYGASTTKFAVFAISGALTPVAGTPGYFTIPLTHVSSTGSFTVNDLVMIQYSRAGNVGAQGAQGVIGAQGVQGVVGAQGVQGVVGAQGVQGVVGAQGVQGVVGAQGVQGVVGAQGVQGVVGAQGVQGVVGAQGVQGVVGAQGVQGVVGAQGVQGVAGTSSYTFQSLVNASQQNGGVIYRTSAAGDSEYVTTQAYHNAYLSFRPGQTNQVVHGGLNDSTSPTGAGVTQYGWYFTNAGAYILFQGTQTNPPYSYTASSTATVYFDGTSVIWVLDGTVRGNVTGASILHSLSSPLYAIGRLQGIVGTTITNFVFGPMGKSGAQGVQGFNGTQGAQGAPGAQGVQGAPGAQGATGGFSTNSDGQVNSLGVGTGASGIQGQIRATGDITAGYSDDRLKTRLGNIENARIKIAAISGFYYEPNQTAQDLGYKLKREVGVSAQEVQSVLPEVVVSAPIDDQYLTVHYEKLVPLLIEAVKDLYEKVEVIETKIKDK
jgi:hypothetical protein